MKILPLINYQNYNNKINRTPSAVQTNVTTPIQRSAVTFSGYQNLGEIFLQQLQKPSRLAELQKASNMFDAITSHVAKKLENSGVSYNEKYNSISPIKSFKSTWSKIQRSGSFDVPDQIRRTLFCKNSYDLSVLKDIIKEYGECDYILAPIDVPVDKMVEHGYIPSKAELKKGFVTLNDLDIRMDRDKITKFIPELNSYISKPQGSGYEDIQMRFINKNEKKSNPIKHEVIILFGDNYAKAKHYESEKIYKFARQLDELKFYKNTKSETLKQRTKDYITAIKSKLSLGISKKLFESANSLDVSNIDNEMLINVSEQELKELNKYFTKLREKGHKYYELAEQRAKSPARLKKIKAEHEADSKLLAEIKKNLEESIAFFNEKQYFKNLPEAY